MSLPGAKASFREFFRHVCHTAGIKGNSAHGLRKAATTRAAEHDATERQLEAMFGLTGGHMAALYMTSADCERMAV